MNIINQDELAFETVNLSSKALMDQLGGEALPAKFYNIPCSSFGSTKKNPFLQIKAVAVDPSIPIEDRMRAVRYMDRIPHVKQLPHTIEAAITILDDESCPIGERYFFMSNHEKTIKLSDHVAQACHMHFFQVGQAKNHPLILRLLSAQYIYNTIVHTNPVWLSAREFIIKLVQDKEETVRIRSEAADILCRKVVKDDAIIGDAVIRELGDLYMKNKLTTIYTNAQNAHNEAITESVMTIIRTLLVTKNVASKQEREKREADREVDRTKKEGIDTFTGEAMQRTAEQNSGDIYERLMKLTEEFDLDRKNKIFASFNLILMYSAKYEGITLSEIMVMIWNKICAQPAEIKQELENRMLEELYDMESGSCGSGLCSRLVNILSGYIQEEGLQIKMSIKDQLRSTIFARLQSNLRLLPEQAQADILTEMSEDHGQKETLREFIQTYGVYDEVKAEFVDMKLIDQEGFGQVYQKALADFTGLSEQELVQV